MTVDLGLSLVLSHQSFVLGKDGRTEDGGQKTEDYPWSSVFSPLSYKRNSLFYPVENFFANCGPQNI